MIVLHYKTLSVLIATVLISCMVYHFRSNYRTANSLLHETANLQEKPFLKAHLKNGEVYILKDTWAVDTSAGMIGGEGMRYNLNRTSAVHEVLFMPIDSVVIFETNRRLYKTEQARITALALMTGVEVAAGIYCRVNPKACFGSCPTFYLNEENDFHHADAEGFTNAIAPSLEYRDVDAVGYRRIPAHMFTITMKNEALETHCVNDVKLLACPLATGERVYHTPHDEYYLCRNSFLPTRATAKEGDITKLLRNSDLLERFSPADSHNLDSKETLYVTFDNVDSGTACGLLMHFRQTLMTTYLIYSAMGYMGDEVSDFFALLATDSSVIQKLENGIRKKLGSILVSTWNGERSAWDYQGEFTETGPIAINRQFLPLRTTRNDGKIQVRIILNKGLWRIDHVSLGVIACKVTPSELRPVAVVRNGVSDSMALYRITEPDQYLLSMPGCVYRFTFMMPDTAGDYDLFLSSKGYYLEWMREYWIKEKNVAKLHQLIDHPDSYLATEGINFKRYETIIEQEFWSSKVEAPSFSYHD